MIKWTDEDIQPAAAAPRNSMEIMVAELSTQPGRWAEVSRYSLDRKGSARSRGAMAQKRYEDAGLQYAVRREGEEFVLYMRVLRGLP